MGSEDDEEALRDTEQRRLSALENSDMAVADLLHAEDYQLISPGGMPLTKERSLGGIASRQFRYHVSESHRTSLS